MPEINIVIQYIHFSPAYFAFWNTFIYELQLHYNQSLMKDKVTIKIPRELYENLQHMIEDTGFSSTTEFIVFVMRTLVSTGKIMEEDRLSEKEVQVIRDRLERLGYL